LLMQFVATGQAAVAPMPSRISARRCNDVHQRRRADFLPPPSATNNGQQAPFWFDALLADPRLATNNDRVLARDGCPCWWAHLAGRSAAELSAVFGPQPAVCPIVRGPEV
jgi:hypothetical protein